MALKKFQKRLAPPQASTEDLSQDQIYNRVDWPTYIRVQRQKKILKLRLKVPPAINQFNYVLDLNTSTRLFEMLTKYKPYSALEKNQIMTEKAKNLSEEEIKKLNHSREKKPHEVITGLLRVTRSIEKKKCQLVCIANNVDPIELVVWLPTLCKKMDIPYCIVKNVAKLGKITNGKNCSCVAIESVLPEDEAALKTIVQAVKVNYNDKFEEISKRWGGGILSDEAIEKQKKRNELLEKSKSKIDFPTMEEAN